MNCSVKFFEPTRTWPEAGDAARSRTAAAAATIRGRRFRDMEGSGREGSRRGGAVSGSFFPRRGVVSIRGGRSSEARIACRIGIASCGEQRCMGLRGDGGGSAQQQGGPERRELEG